MTYAKSLKQQNSKNSMKDVKAFGLILLLVILIFTSPVMAQDLGGYTPPDLFGTNTPVEDTMPDNQGVVEQEQEKPIPKQQPIKIKQQELKQEKSALPSIPRAVKVDSKMKPIEDEPKGKKSFPVKMAKPDKKPIFVKQEPKNTSHGVVKGPKTMPAVQKENVESVVLYQSENTQPVINIAEQTQKPEIEKQPKTITNPDQTEWLFDFEGNNEELSAMQTAQIADEIVPHLILKANIRLSIEATPAFSKDNLMNGARRIALSRALKLRSILIDNDIQPSRITVRTLDAEQTDAPMNQVIINLIN